MAKIKLDNIVGVINNLDATTTNPEVVVSASNITIKNGYLEDATPMVSTLYQDNRYTEEPWNYLPFLPEGWEWETGIYASITQDPLSENQTIFTNTILLLVGKAFEENEYRRTIWYRNWTTDATDQWVQPFDDITESRL